MNPNTAAYMCRLIRCKQSYKDPRSATQASFVSNTTNRRPAVCFPLIFINADTQTHDAECHCKYTLCTYEKIHIILWIIIVGIEKCPCQWHVVKKKKFTFNLFCLFTELWIVRTVMNLYFQRRMNKTWDSIRQSSAVVLVLWVLN